MGAWRDQGERGRVRLGGHDDGRGSVEGVGEWGGGPSNCVTTSSPALPNQVRTFVSGVTGRASGAHHLDVAKIAVLATAATSGALLLSGSAVMMTPAQLFGGSVSWACDVGLVSGRLVAGLMLCCWCLLQLDTQPPATIINLHSLSLNKQ